MKRLIVLLAAGAVCAALAVPAFAATRTVEVGPRVRFGPQSITIHRGDTIRFRFTGRLFHDVVRRRGPAFRKIGVHRGGTFLRRFTRRGTYLLICRVHQPTMDLTVRVR